MGTHQTLFWTYMKSMTHEHKNERYQVKSNNLHAVDLNTEGSHNPIVRITYLIENYKENGKLIDSHRHMSLTMASGVLVHLYTA